VVGTEPFTIIPMNGMLNVVGMIKDRASRQMCHGALQAQELRYILESYSCTVWPEKPGRRQWAEGYGLFSKDFRKHGNQPSGSVSTSCELLQ